MDGERATELGLEKGRVGIIDVGSNSIRLVVYERASRAPLPVFNEKVLCGLARGLDATGRLDPAGVEMALANIDRFITLAQNMKVKSLDLLATAAVRDASDGPEFMRQMAERPGLVSHIVSGRDEARFSGFGVMCGMPGADGVMGDLGGGSLELVALGRDSIGSSSTLPVGPLRLRSSGRGDPRTTIVEAIEGVRWLLPRPGPQPDDPTVQPYRPTLRGVGGSRQDQRDLDVLEPLGELSRGLCVPEDPRQGGERNVREHGERSRRPPVGVGSDFLER